MNEYQAARFLWPTV